MNPTQDKMKKEINLLGWLCMIFYGFNLISGVIIENDYLIIGSIIFMGGLGLGALIGEKE